MSLVPLPIANQYTYSLPQEMEEMGTDWLSGGCSVWKEKVLYGNSDKCTLCGPGGV